MKFKEFQQATKRTLPQLHGMYISNSTNNDVGVISYKIAGGFAATPEVLNLVHMGLGVVSEVNELMDAIAKLDKVGIAEELCDQLWYAGNDLTIMFKAGFISASTYETFANREFGKSYEATDGGTRGDKAFLYANIYNASKLADLTKKYMAYGRPYKIDVYIKSMDYFLASINNIAIEAGIDLEQAMENLINKLRVRYPDKFDAEKAVNRDLAGERRELERSTGGATEQSGEPETELPVSPV